MNKISVVKPATCLYGWRGTTFFSNNHIVFQQKGKAEAGYSRLLRHRPGIQANLPAAAFLSTECYTSPSSDPLPEINGMAGRFWYFNTLSSPHYRFSHLYRSFLNPGGTLSIPAFTGMVANKLRQAVSSMRAKTRFNHWYCKQHARLKLLKDLQKMPGHERNLLLKLKSEKKALCSSANGYYKPLQLLHAA